MLTAKKVERTKKAGRYRCGLVKGLLLQISATGAKLLGFGNHGHRCRHFDPLNAMGEKRGELGSSRSHSSSLYLVGISEVAARLCVILRCRCSSTNPGTSPVSGPPNKAISRTIRELR